MELRINVGNKTYIVPASAISSLVSWLNSNAVELGAARQEVREVDNRISKDPRQLITE